jgi:hypothetical protein
VLCQVIISGVWPWPGSASTVLFKSRQGLLPGFFITFSKLTVIPGWSGRAGRMVLMGLIAKINEKDEHHEL